MNDIDLHKELDRNRSDKELSYAELEAAKNKWAEYVLENKKRICTFQQPIVVKKKKRAIFAEFIKKIKTIFGFTKGKDDNNGAETYLYTIE